MEATDLRSQAQLWRLTSRGTWIRLTNEALGDRWSLDNASDGPNEPILLSSTNASGQQWRLAELATVASGLAGSPTGTLSPRTRLPRRISREVVPNPALEPAIIELMNSHREELWVLVNDLRDVTRPQRVKIPSGKSVTIRLERDAASRIVETWETLSATGQTETVERITEVAPEPWYDISVYELVVQSTVIDGTKKGVERVLEVNRSPKSVGLVQVPPGELSKGGKIDIYAVAKSQRNPGAVRRIDPDQWRNLAANNGPLQNASDSADLFAAPAGGAGQPMRENVPKDAQEHLDRGTAWHVTHEYDRAIAEYNLAIQIDPTSALAYASRGGAWLDKHEYDKAIADYDRAIQLNPKDIWSYLARSDTMYVKREYAKAIADCDRAIQIDPQHPQPWNHKAWRLATCPDGRVRDGQAAVEAAKKAVGLAGDDAFVHRTLAAAYAAAGDFGQAATAVQAAIQLAAGGAGVEDDFRRNLALFKSKQVLLDFPDGQAVRIIMNSTETRAFQATFVKLVGDKVTLKKIDGNTVEVPLAMISTGDREWARQQTESPN